MAQPANKRLVTEATLPNYVTGAGPTKDALSAAIAAQIAASGGGGGGGAATFTNVVATAGTAQTLVKGNNYLTLTSSSCTLTLPASPAAGDEVFLSLKQGGTGNRLVTWPTITWPFGITPVLATGVGAADEFSIRYDGTVWRGVQTASYA